MAASSPLLSIITICRNIATQIDATCASVLRQTWRDFEWIVVDGASTDGTLEVLGEYRRQMTVFISEPDRGVYHAMNKGIARARGEYLLFLNGGDWLATDATLAAFFAVRPTADIVYGDGRYFYPADGFIEAYRNPPPGEIDKAFFAFDIINHQAAFFRRELFTRFGLFAEKYPMVADREKWIVFAENGCSFAKVEAGVAVYRMDGGSSSPETKDLQDKLVEQIRAEHFTPNELRQAHLRHRRFHAYERRFTWGGNRTFSVFAIDETRDRSKRKYRFLNLPLLKRRVSRGRTEYLLLGCAKVWGTLAKAKEKA